MHAIIKNTLLLLMTAALWRADLLHAQGTNMNALLHDIAERYVHLVLATGEHDPDYVDAYYGPPEWLQDARKNRLSLEAIITNARAVEKDMVVIDIMNVDDVLRLRYEYLLTQLRSLMTRVEMLQGKTLTFDEESLGLYDAVAPIVPESSFREVHKVLDRLLPEKESSRTLQERLEAFRATLVVPPERLHRVFTAAIEECRRRTLLHIPLPPSESFRVEYVTGKSWSAYNWYQGNSTSLIQVNTDLPVTIDRAIDLAAHEGYPGHHVYNVLLEDHLLRQRGWVEFSVYPLFSPQSLIAEGTANFGVEVVFSKSEREAFERDVLFPLAGLDTAHVVMYFRVQELVSRLSYASNEAARLYRNGIIDRATAVQWFSEFSLQSPERAEQRIRFIEKYRSYVINYNLGQDMVRSYIERRGGTSDNPAVRWDEFRALLSSPRLPSGLH
jgi:hypothetical protein